MSGSVLDDPGSADCAVVGIGARINSSDDFTTLRLYYRQIIAGTTGLSSTVYYANFGSDPSHSPETNVYTGLFGNDGGAVNKKVMVGVGMKQTNEDVTLIMMHEGVLQ